MAHSNVCCKSRRAVHKRLVELDKVMSQMKDAGYTVKRYTLRSEINNDSDDRKEDLSYLR